MKEIQYEIVKEIAVLSTGDSGYTKEINLIAWNGNEPKYDIRSFSPAREKCGKGITLTKAEAEKLLAALKKELNSEILKGGMSMAKTTVRPKIIVQAAYTGGADMRELFISLLVNEVRRGNSSPRTFEIFKLPQYNEGSTDTKEAS